MRRMRDTSSPHPWGCFPARDLRKKVLPDFPTSVGVFPSTTGCRTRTQTLPHTCGGVSNGRNAGVLYMNLSPHPWGCFRQQRAVELERKRFPTHVGVFPARRSSRGRDMDIPHICGGVSASNTDGDNVYLSSPHPWGCFIQEYDAVVREKASPRPWGCFPMVLADAVTIDISQHPWGCFQDNQKIVSISDTFFSTFFLDFPPCGY